LNCPVLFHHMLHFVLQVEGLGFSVQVLGRTLNLLFPLTPET